MPEAGRADIRAQGAAGGAALPWEDREAFADLMLERDLCFYEQARLLTGAILFDRGIPDIIGYRRLCGFAIPDGLTRAAKTHRYNRHVFIAPPWADIYSNDTERKQDWAEAVATHDAMARVYDNLGYILVPLPIWLAR